MLLNKSNVCSELTTIGLVGGGAALGAVASARGVKSTWYQNLEKPAMQPPAAVFPIVWSALYSAIAAGSLAALTQASPAQRRGYQRALALNMVLNAGWCWTFFTARKPKAALGVAAALAASSADLMLRAERLKPKAGWALAPYALWTGFATMLTGAIHLANPDADAEAEVDK